MQQIRIGQHTTLITLKPKDGDSQWPPCSAFGDDGAEACGKESAGCVETVDHTGNLDAWFHCWEHAIEDAIVTDTSHRLAAALGARLPA